jgi:hypothetical protein
MKRKSCGRRNLAEVHNRTLAANNTFVRKAGAEARLEKFPIILSLRDPSSDS